MHTDSEPGVRRVRVSPYRCPPRLAADLLASFAVELRSLRLEELLGHAESPRQAGDHPEWSQLAGHCRRDPRLAARQLGPGRVQLAGHHAQHNSVVSSRDQAFHRSNCAASRRAVRCCIRHRTYVSLPTGGRRGPSCIRRVPASISLSLAPGPRRSRAAARSRRSRSRSARTVRLCMVGPPPQATLFRAPLPGSSIDGRPRRR